MKEKKYFLIPILSLFLLTGCQKNDISPENEALKQQISELQNQITQLEQKQADMNNSLSELNEVTSENTTTNNEAYTSNPTMSSSQNTENSFGTNSSQTTYTLTELAGMIDEFVASVGSITPDINNSGNLDQFFSLKREGDQLEHILENQENSLEYQYRSGTLSREDFRIADKELEKLDEILDSAFDRLEIIFGIDD